jgi:hypothetical protein
LLDDCFVSLLFVGEVIHGHSFVSDAHFFMFNVGVW